MKTKDIQPINEKGERHDEHGYWEHYHYNGQLWFKGNYVDGNRHGYWEEYYPNGQLKSKIYYI